MRETIPIALVDSIHFLGVIITLFKPDSFLNLSNCTRLKSGLLRATHNPINSNVFLFLIQF